MTSYRNHYGAMCNFSCSIGYRMNGSSTLTCSASGNKPPGFWDNLQPTCQGWLSMKYANVVFVYFCKYISLTDLLKENFLRVS